MKFHTSIQLLLFFFLATSHVQAANYQERIDNIRISEVNGVTRVVFTMPDLNTGCGWPERYIIEPADTGTGKLWTAALLAAKSQNKQIAVIGGGCAIFQTLSGTSGEMETVQAIDVFE